MLRIHPALAKFLGSATSSLALCALAVGCRQASTAQTPTPPTPKVTVQLPVQRLITDYDVYEGRTQAVETVEVRARVDGYLDKIEFEEGQEVQAGQLLFVIDPRPYQATLDRSVAEVARYESQLKLADVEFRRAETLLRKNAGTREDFDKAAAARQVSEAGLQAAQAQVAQDKLNLEFTQVKAPIAGRISRALVTRGNLVIGSVGNPTLLTTIVSLDPIYVYFDVSERQLILYQRQAREGQIRGSVDASRNLKAARIPVYVGLSTDPDFPYQGTLDFAENKVDPETGTIQVRAVLDNKERKLSPGLFARVRVEAAKPYNALLVPESAIGTDQGQKFLLVVDDNRKVVYRRVQLGTLTDDNFRVVSSGLSPTDLVIVQGMLRVRPGMTVDPEQQPPPESAGASLAPPPQDPLPPAPDSQKSEPTADPKGASR